MKKPVFILTQFLLFFFLLALIACGTNDNSATQTPIDENGDHHHETATKKESQPIKALSPRTNAMANIGKTHVHIDYSAPSARGRIIWGGLVAYGQVWVTGAHKATSINFNTPIKIGGKKIEAGTYALFTIPGENTWTLILNENYNQHLADEYDEALDVVRIEVPVIMLDTPVETLTYEVSSDNDQKGKVGIMWDKVRVELPIEVL